MRFLIITILCLSITSPLLAVTSLQEQAVGSLSGRSSSGKLQVEAFAGYPWIVVSKSGKLSDQASCPAIYESQGNFSHIPCFLSLENQTVPPGEKFTIGCCLNLSGTGILLGGYTCILAWDTTKVAYQGYSAVKSGRFLQPIVNDQLVSKGQLIFSEAVAEGDSGLIRLLNVTLSCLELQDSTTSSLDLRVISIHSARTYQNLIALVDVSPATLIIKELIIPDTIPPKIELISQFDYTSDTNGPYFIIAKVSDPNLLTVSLYYRRKGEQNYQVFDMKKENQIFSSSIPGQKVGTVVEYYIKAADSLGNIAFNPPGYQSNPFQFQIIIRPVKRCDFDGNGLITVTDIIRFLLSARNNPTDPMFDWNGDGRYTVADAMSFLSDIVHGNCPDGSVFLASAKEPNDFNGEEKYNPQDIEYIESMISQMNLTADQEADFRLALYGKDFAPDLPKTFDLAQNAPNPFNPSTTIKYSIPEGKSVYVNLKVYDLRGHLVRTLVDDIREPGIYNIFWDGIDEAGHKISSGVYFYTMHAGKFFRTRKLVLIK